MFGKCSFLILLFMCYLSYTNAVPKQKGPKQQAKAMDLMDFLEHLEKQSEKGVKTVESLRLLAQDVVECQCVYEESNNETSVEEETVLPESSRELEEGLSEKEVQFFRTLDDVFKFLVDLRTMSLRIKKTAKLKISQLENGSADLRECHGDLEKLRQEHNVLQDNATRFLRDCQHRFNETREKAEADLATLQQWCVNSVNESRASCREMLFSATEECSAEMQRLQDERGEERKAFSRQMEVFKGDCDRSLSATAEECRLTTEELHLQLEKKIASEEMIHRDLKRLKDGVRKLNNMVKQINTTAPEDEVLRYRGPNVRPRFPPLPRPRLPVLEKKPTFKPRLPVTTETGRENSTEAADLHVDVVPVEIAIDSTIESPVSSEIVDLGEEVEEEESAEEDADAAADLTVAEETLLKTKSLETTTQKTPDEMCKNYDMEMDEIEGNVDEESIVIGTQQYIISTRNNFTWKEARDICADKNMTMLQYETWEEFDDLKKLLQGIQKKHQSSLRRLEWLAGWVGVHVDVSERNRLRWTCGTSEVRDRRGYPRHTQLQQGKECRILSFPWSNEMGVGCETKHAYVCEQKVIIDEEEEEDVTQLVQSS